MLSVNRCKETSLKRLTVHLIEDVALLDSGSSTLDLPIVPLPFTYPWCSTVLKQ